MKKHIVILMVLFLGLIGLFYSPNPSRVSADIPTGPIFGTDFESGLNGWTTTGEWHIENNASSNFPLSNAEGLPSPDHYMWLGDNRTGFGNYSSIDGTLTSPIFDLTEKGRVEFSFYSYKNMYEGNNMVDVTITPDAGGSWYPLLWCQGTAGNLPDNTGFEKITLDFSDSYLRTSSVQIRFSFQGNIFVNGTAGYSGWRIDDIEINEYPEFYIDIYPGGIHAKTLSGEQQRLYFRVNNLFSLVQTVDLTINITTPSGINDTIYHQPVTIAHSTKYGSPYWDYEHYYTFLGEGKYNVTLTIVDEMNNKHSKTVIWEVGPYLTIRRTDLQYYALQGQTRKMEFVIFNYYNYTVNVDISIVIEPPSGKTYSIAYITNETIPSVSSPPDYEAYYFTVDCSFSEDGQNWVHANVSYLGKDYPGDSSFWEVGPYLDINYEFDQNSVLLGEFISFDIYIDPYLFVDTEVNISITVETPSSDVISLLEIPNQLFSPSGLLSETWTDSFSYQALEPGSHRVRIEVINITDPFALWYDLWDKVFNFYAEEADPTLLISQTNKYPDLGDSEIIDFSIQSHYPFDIVVDISIVMTTPSGDDKVLYEEASTEILAVDSWEKSITYTFDEYGLYDVEFLVVNSTTTEWSVRSSWRVREPDSSDSKDTDKVSPGFEVIFVTVILVSITILFRKHRN